MNILTVITAIRNVVIPTKCLCCQTVVQPTRYFLVEAEGNYVRTRTINSPILYTLMHAEHLRADYVCKACGLDTQVHVPDQLSRDAYLKMCQEKFKLHTAAGK